MEAKSVNLTSRLAFITIFQRMNKSRQERHTNKERYFLISVENKLKKEKETKILGGRII